MNMQPNQVLILPGWQGSGPLHWQSKWVQNYAYQLVEQHDWMRPLRGDWLSRLDEVVSDVCGPIYLVAHSLGCIQVAAWANISKQTHRVKAALLVAPGDVEAQAFKDVLSSWRPICLQPLPFKSFLLGSQNDPHCTLERAQFFAKSWGSDWIDIGPKGHLNTDSQLGDWPEAHDFLNQLMKVEEHGH
jgi:predicted alpha/beta hydrolase family esterase